MGSVLALASIGLVIVLGIVLQRPMLGEARVRAADVVSLATTGSLPSEIATLAAPWPTLVQALDGDGVVVASAELHGRPALLRPTSTDREPRGEARSSYSTKQQRFRLDAIAATIAGRPGTVIVATSLGQVDRSTVF